VRARDVIGRTITGVRQQRVPKRVRGGGTELEHTWEVDGFLLDNGKWLILFAVETDDVPIVTASVRR
jgi:hypothetical protein